MTQPGTQPGPTAEDPTGVLPPLLSSDDVDSYQAGDVDWYLTKIGSSLRDVMRWHCWPSVTVTNQLLNVAPDGVVLLPSLYVTNVSQVATVMPGNPTTVGTVLPASSYSWTAPIVGAPTPSGNTYIRLSGPNLGGLDGYLLPYWGNNPGGGGLVTSQVYVSYAHGYPALPDPIRIVAMELLTQLLDERNMPSNYTSLSSGPFHATIREPGFILSENHLRQLGPFTLHGPF